MHPATQTAKSTTVSLLPWIKRIQKLLNYVSGTPVTAPWFMIPAEHQDELPDSEAQQLFADLRLRLCGDAPKPTVSTIRRNLRRFNPDERLVFLYALRYIALRDAHHNKYWPQCRKLLFDNRISLDDLRMRLADDITEQWLILFETTKGRLFRPQFGKRNIKWPLAHAGLLPRDKVRLRDFKADLLRRYQQADYELLLTPELLDDFMSELTEWLHRRVAETDPFLEILRSDERGWITAELAQHHIGQVDIAVPTEELGSARNNHARAELVFLPARQQLALSLTLQFAAPQGAIRVAWEQGLYSCVADASDARYKVTLPLARPTWSASIRIEAVDEPLDLRLRKLPAEPVLFSTTTGRRMRTWELGQSYYLLLPDAYRRGEQESAFRVLFPETREYGPPQGQWPGYTLFWVQVTTLVQDPASSEGQTAKEINRATELLDLPPLDSAWQPHVALVGGFLVQPGDPPFYEATQPPLIHLTGAWQSPLRVEYQSWNELTHRFETRDTCVLPAHEHVQEHWLHYAEPADALVGRHRMLVAGQPTEWHTRLVAPRFQQRRLTGSITLLDGEEPVQRPNRALMTEQTLQVQAWPYAELVLRAQGVTTATDQRLRLDASGESRLRVRDSVIAQMPPEPLHLSILWNGIPLCAPLVCHTGSGMLADDLLVAFRDTEPDTLEIIGQLRDTVPGTFALVIVLGREPWHNQLWQKRQRVQADGLVTLALPVDRSQARWVLLCTQRGSASPEGLLVYALPGNSTALDTTPGSVEGATLGPWKRCLGFLETLHLPQDLRHVVRHTQMEALRRHNSLVHRKTAAWTDLTTVMSYQRVSTWRDLGLDIPVAICTWTPSDPAFNPDALYLSPRDLLACSELARRAGTTRAVDVCYPNGVHTPWAGGQLISEDDEGDVVVRLQASTGLYGCAECRVALPMHLGEGHAHLALHGHRCRRDGANRSSSQRVRIVAFFEPLNLLRQFQRLLQRALAGHDIEWPGTFEGWLDRVYTYFENSGFAQEERWLDGLVDALGVFICLLEGDCKLRVSAGDELLLLSYQQVLLTLLQLTEEL